MQPIHRGGPPGGRRRSTFADCLALAIVVVALTGCVSDGEASPAPSAGSPTPAPSAGPALVPSASVTTSVGRTYRNPVYPLDFPDPHILTAGTTYYAYATNASTANVPVIRSTDLARWERIGDAMPALPAWAIPNFGYTWAPGVIEVDGAFVLFFVARDAESDRQCVGVARTETPEGPFVSDAPAPLVCQVELGGSIDPYPFRDADGQLLLYWKNDGNCCAKPVGLWVQPLAADGLSLAGAPVELIRRDQPWEIPLIENPAMVGTGGRYYLFYSANRWDSFEYAVGYAVCETAIGPCEKPLEGPIFAFTPEAMGPGGQAFFTDLEGNLWMAYHAWTGPQVGYPAGARSLRLEPVGFADGAPVIRGPTTDPQALP